MMKRTSKIQIFKAALSPIAMIALLLTPPPASDTLRLVIAITVVILVIYSAIYQVQLAKIRLENRLTSKDPLKNWRDSKKEGGDD